MKITEITQPEKLDEIAFLPVLALAGAGLTGYDIYKNARAFQRGEISKAELTARVGGDIALGVIGGGIAGAFKVVKGALKGATRLNRADMAGAKEKIKQAKAELKTAKDELKGTGPKSKLEKERDEFMAQQGKNPDGSPLTTKPDLKDKVKQARIGVARAKAEKGELKKAAGTRKRDIAKDAGRTARNVGGATLLVPDTIDPVRDPAYRVGHALAGNKVRGDQPAAGTPGTPGMKGKSMGSKPLPKLKKPRSSYGTGLGDPEYLRKFGK